MFRMMLVAGAALVVGGCASTGTHGDAGQARSQGMGAAKLVSSSTVPPGSVHYDAKSGKCSSGVQLLDKATFDSLVSQWNAPANCKMPSKSQVPSTTGYPDVTANLHSSGSAQVLVLLEANGYVDSVHAMCATDADYARAAEETAKAISYAPATCDGVPARGIFLLPFHYER